MDSILPVEYHLHDVPGAWIDDYFIERYTDHLRPVLIP